MRILGLCSAFTCSSRKVVSIFATRGYEREGKGPTMRMTRSQGFTLIELLIVIAIIGILAAVLIPRLVDVRSRAFDVATQACLREIVTAEELYSLDHASYASNVDLAASIPACSDIVVSLGADSTTASYHYLAEHPLDGQSFEVTPSSGVRRSTATP